MKRLICMVLLIVLIACTKETDFNKNTKEKVMGMRALMIVAQYEFRDEELTESQEVLKRAGIEVEIATTSPYPAKGMLGLEVYPDLSVSESNVDDYDTIIIIGGSGSPELANHPEVLDLLVEAQSKNKLIASICLGPTVLAKAGILHNKTATCFPSGSKVLLDNGAEYSDEDIVVDKNIITASGPEVAISFAKKIVEVLSSR